MELKRVVVTGLGSITPIGKNVPEYWEKLKNGVSGSGHITRFDASKFKTQFAAEIPDYNSKDYFDRKEAKKLDLFTQFALISSDEAIKDSGVSLENIDKDRAGVIWGSGIGGISTFGDEMMKFSAGDGTPRFSPFFIPKMISDIAAGQISIKYGMRGPNFSTVSACASASHALIDAFNYIRLGKADMFVSGGSEAAISEAGVAGFNAMKAISTRNEDPEAASRPFDVDRDGFVIGEGAGALILEEYEHAVNRGAPIYAEVAGGGLTADAYHLTAPHPDGYGAYKVMEFALDDAGLNKGDIDYINVHGTSTPVGDVVEPKAICDLFGDEAYNLSISSSKSMVGHLLGAAGGVESIAAILALKNNIVPPTINLDQRDPKIDQNLDLVPQKAKETPVRASLSNTFGFGGHNATIIFKELQ